MIYLDNAATTAPVKEALERAEKFYAENYFNPSAQYAEAVNVRREIERAREFFTELFPEFSLLFTSGGTEADNQAIFSFARRGNAVTTMGEHPAVENCFKKCKDFGVEPRFARVEKDGSVTEEELLSLVDEKTSLVSVVHVNSETGAVNDINALAKAVKRKNPRCKFHSDGVQAFGKIPVRLGKEIDLYSVSAHKIGGIKGTGALLFRKGTLPQSYLFGGGQEGNLRSGTENVLGILCFFYAAQELKDLKVRAEKFLKLRELLFSSLDPEIFTRISTEAGSPYILTVSARGMRGEVLQRMLDLNGVIVGTGSACSSKHPHSRILKACGYPEDVLDGVLRMSFFPEITEKEILTAADALNACAREWKEKL